MTSLPQLQVLTDQYLAAYVLRHIKVEDIWVHSKQGLKYSWFGSSANKASAAFNTLRGNRSFFTEDDLLLAHKNAAVQIGTSYQQPGQATLGLNLQNAYEVLSNEKLARNAAGVNFTAIVEQTLEDIECAFTTALQRDIRVKIECGSRDSFRTYGVYDRSSKQLRRGKVGKLCSISVDATVANKIYFLQDSFSYNAQTLVNSLDMLVQVRPELEKVFILG